MTNEEAIKKMEFLRNAYKKLIDEGVDNGRFVGTGVEGQWKSSTPLNKCNADLCEACEMAIEALEKEIPKSVAQPKELVRYGMGERYDDYGCPLCGTFLASEPQGNQQKGLTRCWKCGQIVKWGD